MIFVWCVEFNGSKIILSCHAQTFWSFLDEEGSNMHGFNANAVCTGRILHKYFI